MRSIVATLAEATFGARAVERQPRATPDDLRGAKVGLTDAATVPPTPGDAIDRKTGRSSAGSA